MGLEPRQPEAQGSPRRLQLAPRPTTLTRCMSKSITSQGREKAAKDARQGPRLGVMIPQCPEVVPATRLPGFWAPQWHLAHVLMCL